MEIIEEQIRKIAPYSPKNVSVFVDYLNEYMEIFDIDTVERVCMFIAQIAHESGSFHYVREISSGAQYENRKDLGNIHPGDGKFFKGRGLIQITGRSNYKSCSLALFNDLRLLDTPQLLEIPQYAVASACWFWWSKGLNELADKGKFKSITKKINGGLNGYADRLNFYDRAKEVIQIAL